MRMMFMTRLRPSVLSVFLAFPALVGPAVVTEAETRFVANNGLDSNNTCVAHPCRSIGHAIQNANSGDTTVVGPGRYSWESEPGPGFCSCVIQVDKPLTIESRDGAGVTVLDATGHTVNVVQIEASDVIFGELQKGFTLTGAVAGSVVTGSGLVILAGTSGVKVRGNLATRNGAVGFDVEIGSGHHLRGNTASANGTGFHVEGSGHHLRGNTASANNLDGFGVVNNGNGQGMCSKGTWPPPMPTMASKATAIVAPAIVC
jgi:parallel beta-helix repeat protein